MRAFVHRAGDGGRGWPHATDRTASATVLHRLAAASAGDPEKSVSVPNACSQKMNLARKVDQSPYRLWTRSAIRPKHLSRCRQEIQRREEMQSRIDSQKVAAGSGSKKERNGRSGSLTDKNSTQGDDR